MHAEDDDRRWRLELLDARRDFDAVQFRHRDVEDEHVGQVLGAQPHRFRAICRFSDHGDAGRFEQPAQAAADDAVVVS